VNRNNKNDAVENNKMFRHLFRLTFIPNTRTCAPLTRPLPHEIAESEELDIAHSVKSESIESTKVEPPHPNKWPQWWFTGRYGMYVMTSGFRV
jgi:hypothetical protein